MVEESKAGWRIPWLILGTVSGSLCVDRWYWQDEITLGFEIVTCCLIGLTVGSGFEFVSTRASRRQSYWLLTGFILLAVLAYFFRPRILAD